MTRFELATTRVQVSVRWEVRSPERFYAYRIDTNAKAARRSLRVRRDTESHLGPWTLVRITTWRIGKAKP